MTELYQLANALFHPEESSIVRNPTRLGKVVRNDDHGVATPQALDQLLDHA